MPSRNTPATKNKPQMAGKAARAVEGAKRSTVTIDGKKFVLIPAAEYKRLVGRARVSTAELAMPELPPADENGTFPASATIRAMIAREIIERRTRAGLTQAELARRAGIRVETLNRIERAVYAPNATTAAKIEAALGAA